MKFRIPSFAFPHLFLIPFQIKQTERSNGHRPSVSSESYTIIPDNYGYSRLFCERYKIATEEVFVKGNFQRVSRGRGYTSSVKGLVGGRIHYQALALVGDFYFSCISSSRLETRKLQEFCLMIKSLLKVGNRLDRIKLTVKTFYPQA